MGLEIQEVSVTGFEKVVKFTDVESGLKSIIAIHDTTLGPALGGTRIYPYNNFEEALCDVLRLAEGMTYKSALAGMPLGGGKSVIIADPHTDKTPALLHAFAEAVNTFKGHYICAEDMGSTCEDMALVRQRTPFVGGLPGVHGSGDPGRFTARGVYYGIRAVAQKLWGSPSLRERTLAIQGLGSVGARLADLLFWEGAHLIVADVDDERINPIVRDYRAEVVHPAEILQVGCDILVPCARGGLINDETIPLFSCKAIAGATNNQLGELKHGDLLAQRGILYAPDFVINSGGLINVATEFDPAGYKPSKARARVENLYNVILNIFDTAEEQKLAPGRAAEHLAKQQVEEAKRAKAR